MTNAEVIQLLATDPSIVRATMTLEPGATQPRALTHPELESKAQSAISLAVTTLFQDPTVRRNYLAYDTSLALTAGTTSYDLPKDCVEVLDITMPSSGRPLKKFSLEVEWNQWAYENGASQLKATDPVVGFHRAPRATDGRFRIRLVPGVSSADAGVATVWYVKSLGNQPYAIESMPAETHDLVFTVAKDYMMGQSPIDAAKPVLDSLQRTSELVKGAVLVAKRDPQMEINLRNRNATYTPDF